MTVNSAATAAQIQTLLEGTGVTISNLGVTGDGSQWGSFADGTVNSGAPTDPVVNIDAGLVLSTGDVADAPGPNNTNASTNAPGTAPADPDLPTLQANATNDTVTVTFDIVAQDDFLEFNFAFASEEYNEYVCSNFNDAMGIFVGDLGGPFTGGAVNAGLAPQSNDIISINTINNGTVGSNGSAANCLSLANAALFKDNAGGANLVFDGLTANISKFVAVTAGVTYTVKLVLADAGDSSFDSAVFFGPINSATTHALVTNFDLGPSGDVLWTTGSQIGTLGFAVEQWEGDRWEPVHHHPLPARVDAPQGAHYRLVADRSLGGGPFRILETEVGGTVRVHGPFVPHREGGARGREARAAALAGPQAYSSSPRAEDAELLARRAAARRERSAGERVTRGELRRTASSVSSARALLHVDEPGVTRVDAADLAAALGVSAAQAQQAIAAGQVRLESGGVPVPWTAPSPQALFFLATGSTSVFSATQVIEVRFGTSAVMIVDDGGLPSPAAGESSTTTRAVFETQAFAATAVSHDPLGDFWFWLAFAAGNPSFDTRDVTVTLVDWVPGTDASLETHVYGTSETVAGDDHSMAVSWNAAPLGRTTFGGVGPAQGTYALASTSLAEGDHTVTLQAELLPGVPSSFPYADRIELVYERYARASLGRLEVTPSAGGVLTASRFPTGSVLVLREVSPGVGALVQNVTVDSDAFGHRASWVAQGGATYHLADTTMAQTGALVPVTALPLPDPSLGGELVVIAPPSLHAAAQDYVNFRQSRGVDAVLVDAEAVWLRYAGGVRDPRAIHAFLADAWSQWSTPPRYALLMGHGNYDYADVLGQGDNLLPPLLVPTTGGLYSSDMVLGDVASGDGVPEVVVGRLPVLQASEVQDYISKVSPTEVPGLARWNHVALVGDNRDAAGPFDTNVGDLSGLLPTSVTQEQILLDDLSVPQARAQVKQSFDLGAQLVAYVGHGGLDQFAAEGLLTSSDVGALQSQGQLPIVMSLTCSVGRFEVPGFVSLAERLTLDQDAGATAVWAPSGVSFNTSANLLGRFFVEAAVQDDAITLGEALAQALRSYDTFGSLEELGQIYNLIGDPSLEMWSETLVEPPVDLPTSIFSVDFESGLPEFATVVKPRPGSN